MVTRLTATFEIELPDANRSTSQLADVIADLTAGNVDAYAALVLAIVTGNTETVRQDIAGINRVTITANSLHVAQPA